MPNPSLPRQTGKRQSGEERRHNYEEVAQGCNLEEAMQEAERCLNCKDAPCTKACPVNVQIPEFIQLLKEGKIGESASKIMETSLLPAICGRVCPQETHCEGNCVLHKGGKFPAVAVGLLERFVADEARKQDKLIAPKPEKESGFKVAMIGSGPSSLSCAAELRKLGHKVVVFEALHDFGGVLRYGIPSFRLPREIIKAEVDTISDMGVEITPDILVGSSITLDELREEYDAVYIGSGAGLPTMPNIPGENLVGVYSANEFLTRVNLMQAYRFPEVDTPVHVGKNVVVLGGGNSAMDAARCAMRLGRESVTIVYRRGKDGLPAREEEIENAEEEGIKFQFLTVPKEIVADEDGKVAILKCLKTELGEPDASGRRRPQVIEGSGFDIKTDSIIIALGQSPNPIITNTNPDLKTNKWGAVELNEAGETSLKGVYAGGDITRGGATVLLAMKDGIEAAEKMHKYLETKGAK